METHTLGVQKLLFLLHGLSLWLFDQRDETVEASELNG